MTKKILSQSPKIIIGFLINLFYRLLPVRIPNVEPIMATTMPFAKEYGWQIGLIFPFLSIFIYDLFTSGIGLWTWTTSITYALIGLAASKYFQNKKSSTKNYLFFAIFATLFYDLITGVLFGPIMFGQSLTQAFLGQIPFTIYHLLSNIIFALIFSPLIYKGIIKNHKLNFAENMIKYPITN